MRSIVYSCDTQVTWLTATVRATGLEGLLQVRNIRCRCVLHGTGRAGGESREEGLCPQIATHIALVSVCDNEEDTGYLNEDRWKHSRN